VLEEVCGLQAQVLSAAWLGVRARSRGIGRPALDRALNQQRSIVRAWLMRGTLHVVAAEDFRWLLQLLGPVFIRAGATRQAQLGLDDAVKSRAVAAIRTIVTDTGPLTRWELVDRLRKRNITLDAKSQAPIHLIRLAALQGILCLGPDRGDGESTYALLDDWLSPTPALSRESALAELARRYFAAYGPATVEDLSAWSGLPMREARSAVNGALPGLDEVMIQGRPGLAPKRRLDPPATPPAVDVGLLPAFDAYLLGYRSRDLAVAPPLQRRLQRGGGWLHPAVVVNGRAVAAWNLDRTGRQARITIEPFERLGQAVRTGIDIEVRDIGRFIDRPITSSIGEPALTPAPRGSGR
jgi:winged helix DNA-binding protein